jgi:hypothetical protein
LTPQDADDDASLHDYSYMDGLAEQPRAVVFNGREGSLTERPLLAKTDETVRLYFGNAGPNLASAFHVIGTVFDRHVIFMGFISNKKLIEFFRFTEENNIKILIYNFLITILIKIYSKSIFNSKY